MRLVSWIPFSPFFLLFLIGSTRLADGSGVGFDQRVDRAAKKQPNVLFIFCDDLGWGDFGVLHQNRSQNSKKHRTPNIDRMASEGVLMTAHYCGAPVCAPSRATLLSGVHQGHAEVRDNQFDKALANNHTLATVLRDAGYATWMVGKHGLQGEGDNPQEWPAYPTKRGFDRFYGYVRHADGHVHYPADPWPLGNSDAHRSGKQVWSGEVEVSDGLSKCYTTDLFTARAKKWVVEHVQSKKPRPFFLYLAYDTPHAALQLPTGPFPAGAGLDGGLEWIGESGKMINTAVGEVDSFRHPDYVERGWKDVEERFATMVRRIDDCVGDLLQTLRDLGIDEETIVVISSDNGPLNVSYLSGQPIEANSFQSYGPFDGIKRDCWEGGIRMATVAWGPGYIGTNLVDDHPSQSQDWMATFADFAGTLPPARCDGVSLRASLTGRPTEQVASRIYVEYSNGGKTPRYPDFEARKRGKKRGQMQVVHVDGYKGIRVNIKKGDEPFEIYQLDNDRGERNDLSTETGNYRDLQYKMQASVLRGRRPNPSAPRPYDALPVPALKLTPEEQREMTTGVRWRYLAGIFSYTPDMRNVIKGTSGTASWVECGSQPEVGELGAFEIVGHLRVPVTGEYEFRVRHRGRGYVRLHEMSLIDLDYGRGNQLSSTVSVKLQKGWHPFRFTSLVQAGVKEFEVEWKVPGEEQFAAVEANQWFVPAK